MALPSTKAGMIVVASDCPTFCERRHIAGRWQPAEIDRDQQDQHDAQPEGRRGQAGQAIALATQSHDSVALHRREHAGRHADQHRDDEGHRAKLQRDRQLLLDQMQTGSRLRHE